MRKAGEILRVFLDRHTADQAELYNKFFNGWRKVVGERIAAHSVVTDIQSGTVVVEVDHPGWIQMIQMRQARIVEILRREYPDLEIRALRMQLPWKGGGKRRTPIEGEAALPSAEDDAAPAVRERQEPPVETSSKGPGGGPPTTGTEHRRRGAEQGGEETEEELPPDPRIRSALSRLGRAIEEREDGD